MIAKFFMEESSLGLNNCETTAMTIVGVIIDTLKPLPLSLAETEWPPFRNGDDQVVKGSAKRDKEHLWF